MTVKSWRVEITERILVGREFEFHKQPRLSFAVQADVPSAAKKLAKQHFNTHYGLLGDLISAAIRLDNKITLLFEARRKQVVALPGKIQKKPAKKLKR
jgi:hypothetical protein